MSQVIRTRLHRFFSLMENREEVYFTSPPHETNVLKAEPPLAKPMIDFGAEPEEFVAFLKAETQKMPKFVVEDELLFSATKGEYYRSILDMKRAGVMKLPYPQMVVEFTSDNHHHFIILYDVAESTYRIAPDETNKRFPFCGIVFHINKDTAGEYAVVSPSVSFIDMQEHDGEPWIQATSGLCGIVSPSPELNQLVKDTYQKDASYVYYALIAALLLMNTNGVAKEVIDCERLNKRRVVSNKLPVPRHTYIYIGKVYRSAAGDKADDYIPRKSPRPHWRRGHNRNVHYGTNREKVKLQYFPGRLVALGDAVMQGQPDPELPTYIVRR